MGSTEGRRGQAERRNKTEEALLDAAADLIARRGVERASLADIGELAGVSRGLPNHRFGSKSALVAKLAERSQMRMLSDLNAALVEARKSASGQILKGNGLEALLMGLDLYLEKFSDPSPDERALLVMWGSILASESLIEGMKEADQRSYEALAGLVAAGQQDGSIRADLSPIGTAMLVLGVIRGVASLHLIHGQTAGMSNIHSLCRQWLRTCLSPHSTVRAL